MATQASSQLSPSAQVVGNAFVEQYYQILHQSPELVYRFYTDMSVLSRPGPDGIMTSVKTMEAINEVIVSLDYKDYRAEIKTIDAQDSYQSGVVVLVTGWLTVKDNVKRKFTQSFFLAPQDKGYFVLNDIFRYLDEDSQQETNAVDISVEGTTENIPASAPVTSVPEPTVIPDHPVPDNTTPTPTPAPAPAPAPTPAVEVVYGNGEVVHEPLSNGEVSVVEIQVVEVPVQSVKTEVNLAPEPASTTPEDTPKKLTQSYASILKDTKATKVTKVAPPVSARTNIAKASIAKVAAGNIEQLSAPAPAPGDSAPSSNNGANGSNIPEEVEGYSIYVRSLPMNATVPQVEEEFKKFGPIRPNGVQVRSNKGFCFGFVEFEKQSSMQSALEATPVNIGNRQVHVEEKRTTTRVGPGGRPRFPPGRNGFRNDNFRGRGNFSGGRGYGRSEYGNRGDFSGRRSSSGRSGDGYQRVEHNVGNGRVPRQGANQTAVSV